MSDNLLQTLQTAIQDVIAPDVREFKVKVAALQEQTKLQYESLHEQIAPVSGKSDAQFKTLQEQIKLQSILAAIGQNKAEAELATMRTIATPSEHVAVLEATRH